jgi:hypothetical protein
MSRTGHETEQLGYAQYEVKDLGDEEQEQGLGKVSLDRDDCKRHPGEIAKGVPNKDSSGEPAKRWNEVR